MSGVIKIDGITLRLDRKTITDQGSETSSASAPVVVTPTKTFYDFEKVDITPVCAYAVSVILDDHDEVGEFDGSFEVTLLRNSDGVQVAEKFYWGVTGI